MFGSEKGEQTQLGVETMLPNVEGGGSYTKHNDISPVGVAGCVTIDKVP